MINERYIQIYSQNMRYERYINEKGTICVQLVKHYAKNIYVNRYSEDKMIPMLNIYLYRNSQVLDIVTKYQLIRKRY